jgi:hypothetical protein
VNQFQLKGALGQRIKSLAEEKPFFSRNGFFPLSVAPLFLQAADDLQTSAAIY